MFKVIRWFLKLQYAYLNMAELKAITGTRQHSVVTFSKITIDLRVTARELNAYYNWTGSKGKLMKPRKTNAESHVR